MTKICEACGQPVPEHPDDMADALREEAGIYRNDRPVREAEAPTEQTTRGEIGIRRG